MTTLTNDVRHEVQRGVILIILAHRNLEWVPLSELKAQMARGQGYPLSEEELWFHLRYLESRGYLETRAVRPGRPEFAVMRARAMPKTIDLLDHRIEADPGIAF
ncbi:MAG TPA: hypothetical protein VL523_08945 [Terriglobia bacterium]|nr:hypothetical protein [Terriglobia bacterium]